MTRSASLTMRQYSIEPRKKHVKDMDFCNPQENIKKIIGYRTRCF